jgi:uncharacterized membrane protein required for colicin V production
VGVLGLTLVGGLAWFIIYCLDHGKDAFVLDLIKAIGWLISLFLSYFAGKKVGQSKSDSEIKEMN